MSPRGPAASRVAAPRRRSPHRRRCPRTVTHTSGSFSAAGSRLTEYLRRRRSRSGRNWRRRPGRGATDATTDSPRSAGRDGSREAKTGGRRRREEGPQRVLRLVVRAAWEEDPGHPAGADRQPTLTVPAPVLDPLPAERSSHSPPAHSVSLLRTSVAENETTRVTVSFPLRPFGRQARAPVACRSMGA
jgi:hypothetical protein